MAGSIPTSFGKLRLLRFLDLKRNRLTGEIPQTLIKLQSLEHLGLQENQLYGEIPRDLHRLTSLQSLLLHNNRLRGELPKTLGKLTSLTELDLSGNSITGVIPHEIGKVLRLQLLDIGNNSLNCLIPAEIGKLEFLVTLNLLGNNLTGPVPDELGRLTMLEWVFLSVKRLEGPSPSDLGHLDSLSSLGRLALSKNKLFGIPRTLADRLGDDWDIPTAVVNGGRQQIVKYFEDTARSGEVVINSLKVAVVGTSREAGKTTLASSVDVEAPLTADIPDQLEFVLWDSGGHPDYYPTAHRLFYTRWALYLLVVNLYRFEANVASRREMVNDWLDALLSIIPGTAILLVPTHTDNFGSEKEMNKALENLKKFVAEYLETRREGDQNAAREHKKVEGSGAQALAGVHTERVPVLIVCGIKAISGKKPRDIEALQAEILDKHSEIRESLTPRIGQPFPKIWARAGSVLDGYTSGEDLLPLSVQVQDHTHLAEAADMWTDVLQSLGQRTNVRWQDNTLKAIVALKQHDGTMLQTCGIMHLVPSWINKFLRALADHRLADPNYEEWWEKELETFIESERTKAPPDLLFKAHRDFRNTGQLSPDYLMFLWREMDEIKNDPDVVDSLIEAAISHRVMLKSPKSTVHETEFLVPRRLQPEVESDALVRLREALSRGRGIKFNWGFRSFPSDIIELVLTQVLAGKRARIHACWRTGVIFTMDDLEYLIYIHAESTDDNVATRKATLELSVAAPGYSMPLQNPANVVKERLDSMIEEFYPEVTCSVEEHDITSGELTWDASVKSLLDIIDIRLDQLDRIYTRVGEAEGILNAVLEQTRVNMKVITDMYDRNFPYPKLVVIRPETEDDRKESVGTYSNSWSSKRFLDKMADQIKGYYTKPMRLFFICPVYFEEVPCGWDGAGYPLRMDREWYRKIYPAVEASLSVVRAACKIGLGIDLPVSDFLGSLSSEVGEAAVDRYIQPPDPEEGGVLDNGAEVKETPSGDNVYSEFTGQAYEALQKFMKEQETASLGHHYIPHNEKMRLCNDEKKGRVWVSLKNIDKWNARLADGAQPEVSVPSPPEVEYEPRTFCCFLS